MSKTESLYLDVWRFACAVVVMFGHVSGKRFTGGLMWQASFFMSQAVVVFFVLSGYVISYVASTREHGVKEYATSRLARLYSVVVPALLLTAALDALGRTLAPSAYSTSWGFGGDNVVDYIKSLFFVNEVWFSHASPGSDLPFWSLGYEAWYYAIVGVVLFARRLKWVAAAALAAVAGPDIISMFPLWLMGFAAYRCRPKAEGAASGHSKLAAALSISSLCALATYEALAWRYGRLFSNATLFLNRGELPEDYLVGLLFAAHFWGLSALMRGWSPRPPQAAATAIRWLAGATFSIYLYHLPIAQFVSVVLPADKSSLQMRAITVFATFSGIFLMAEVSERRKHWWRAIILRGFDLASLALNAVEKKTHFLSFFLPRSRA